MSAAPPNAIASLPAAAPRWREALRQWRSHRSSSLILSGSVIMLVGSGIVNACNFGYNVAVARLLGPEGFGHASAAVTLLMLASAITPSFQMVFAKFVACNDSPGAKANIYVALLRRSWVIGLLLAAGMTAASLPIADFLRLPSPWFVILLALGIAFYIPLGVKRGGLQGDCSFLRLNVNMGLEVMVKFGLALLLVGLGYGVMGAVGAITASVIAAYYLPPMGRRFTAAPERAIPASFPEGVQAIVFFVGQVIINNSDILLVKHYFSAADAGIYAGIALVGRVLLYSSWQVVSAMFPISAGAREEKEDPSVLAVPLLLVTAISVLATLVLAFFPGPIMGFVFGAGFHEAESLLSLQAAATGCYALAVVLMTYEMSRKLVKIGWLQLACSGIVMLGIVMFHATLREVVLVQLVFRVLLLIASSVPFLRARRLVEEAA